MQLPFTEVGPQGPQPDGDVGGDDQLGESYSRRFHAQLANGQHAVVTTYFYVAGQQGEAYGDRIQRQDEFIVCTDPVDPGSTEIQSDYRYRMVNRGVVSDKEAYEAAQRCSVHDVDWPDDLEWMLR